MIPKIYKKNLRKKGHDYRSPGYYFFTIITHKRLRLFGEVKDAEMCLNLYGQCVQTVWHSLPGRFTSIEPGDFQVMPDHVHGMLRITGSVTNRSAAESESATLAVAPTGETFANSADDAGASPALTLGDIIGAFKSISYLSCLQIFEQEKPGQRFGKMWHNNYHDSIVRGHMNIAKVEHYIRNNPARWWEKHGR